MPMTTEQCSAALMRLREVWPKGGKCSCCESNEWGLSGVVEARDYFCAPTATAVGVVPLLLVGCKKCGMTLTFNAVRLGLVSRETGEFVMPKTDEVEP